MSGHLASALARLDAALFAMSPRLPQDAPTARMIVQLSAVDKAPQPPQERILEALRQRLRTAMLEDREPNHRDVKSAPWILWEGDPPAISFPGLFYRVVDLAIRSPRTLNHLIEAWLLNFKGQGVGVSAAGSEIQRLLTAVSNARMDSWRAAHGKYRIFDAARGPATLAAAILGDPEPVSAVLEAACLADQTRAVGNYMRAVQDEVLEKLPNELERPGAGTTLARACTFLMNGGSLRFAGSRTAVAKALCKPWLPETARSPGADVQREVKDFLVAHLGNPQLRPDSWSGAKEEAALIKRWMARASLSVFFELIAEHAYDQQWKYREAFWSAYLARGAIDDAWLALGSNIHASARANQELGDAFGRMAGGGGSQTVLLLRIGPLIFAEWSHNGSLRAWPYEQGPKLGQRTYTKSQILRPCLPFQQHRRDKDGLPHIHPETDWWQLRAAQLIRAHASVTIPASAWRVR